jgi:undecaprenyl-diphosphatase
MEQIDTSILYFFVKYRTEWLSFLMLTVTYAGGYLISSLVAAFSITSFLLHREFKKAATLLLATLGSTLTIFLIKDFFGKVRPSQAVYLENSYSFPSGHATIAVALYGFLLYFAYKHDPHHFKNPFIVLLAILILLIGASRLYLGVHYLSDVLAGYLVGLIWIGISLAIVRPKI